MNRLMVVVVAVNLGIALGGLYLAWRLWHFKQACAALTDTLTTWERHLPKDLTLTSDLDLSRQQLLRLRQQYIALQRWLGYLPYLRLGLKLMVGQGLKRRNRFRQRDR